MTLTCVVLKQNGGAESVSLVSGKGTAAQKNAASLKVTTEFIMTKLLKKKKGDPPSLIGTYPFKQKTLFLFGFDDGVAANENQHQLPPPLEGAQVFGDIVVIASASSGTYETPVSFSTSEYETFYTSAMEGDGEEEEDEELDQQQEETAEVIDDDVAEEADEEEDVDYNDEGEGEGDGEEEKEWGEEEEDTEDVKAPIRVVPAPKVSSAKKKQAAQLAIPLNMLSTGPELEQEDSVVSSNSLPPIRRSILKVLEQRFQSKLPKESLCVLEHCIYNTFLESCDKKKISRSWTVLGAKDLYMSIARSIIGNLDQSSYIGNQSLFQAVHAGEMSMEQLVKKNAYELYPENWQSLIDQQVKREQIQLEGDRSRATDRFQCNRCGKRETTYYELQTRSADEPMTIFINCLPCGKRWTQ